MIDVDVVVTCSTGTYIARWREISARPRRGGHLTTLRRTRVGSFDLTAARTLEQLDQHLAWLPLDRVCGDLFPRHTLTTDEAQTFRHGGSTDWPSAIPAQTLSLSSRLTRACSVSPTIRTDAPHRCVAARLVLGPNGTACSPPAHTCSARVNIGLEHSDQGVSAECRRSP